MWFAQTGPIRLQACMGLPSTGQMGLQSWLRLDLCAALQVCAGQVPSAVAAKEAGTGPANSRPATCLQPPDTDKHGHFQD